MVIEYLPGNPKAQEEADWIINRLVENGIKSLPEDFLEYHKATFSPARGMRGPVFEVEEYLSIEAFIKEILGKSFNR